MLQTRDIQLGCYEIFKEFDRFCRNNNLRYYLLGGTMLGAIRHKGFIPWDDDMDVGMPREDYEKLLRVRGHFEEKGIAVKNSNTEKNYSYDFTKMTRTVDGADVELFLDIFPLDGCPYVSPKKIKGYYTRFDTLRMMKNSHFMTLENKNAVKKVLVCLLRLNSLKKYLKVMDKYLKRNGFDDSAAVGNFSGHWREKEIMPKHIYGTPTLVEFEGKMYYGVENPDAYLTAMYGDYMKIPPEKERLTHFNLGEE